MCLPSSGKRPADWSPLQQSQTVLAWLRRLHQHPDLCQPRHVQCPRPFQSVLWPQLLPPQFVVCQVMHNQARNRFGKQLSQLEASLVRAAGVGILQLHLAVWRQIVLGDPPRSQDLRRPRLPEPIFRGSPFLSPLVKTPMMS